jgi:chromatin remodeling complex protein RSC6
MATMKKSGSSRKSAAKKAAKRPAAKKSPAKKGAARKSAAKGAGRKSAAKKSSARKAPAKKSAAKKGAAKKAAAKKGARKATKRAPNPAFMRAMTPSADLGAVVGNNPMPRTEVTKKVWDYIKKNNLQDPNERRTINADDKLKKVFGGKSRVSMFEMTKYVNNHLK